MEYEEQARDEMGDGSTDRQEGSEYMGDEIKLNERGVNRGRGSEKQKRKRESG
ncbi:Hypothetical protein SMAX5B_012785 [Scophthalmus maximus]|uniref:Uncharacterized protein n=1 Tax=Scophthalmus maximus TaxID=52904 RepID=A0A2U9BY11_SCOMX|nr:Hypothetical protein SMAX5B_012785 [Scophthalmus maximus]